MSAITISQLNVHNHDFFPRSLQVCDLYKDVALATACPHIHNCNFFSGPQLFKELLLCNRISALPQQIAELWNSYSRPSKLDLCTSQLDPTSNLSGSESEKKQIIFGSQWIPIQIRLRVAEVGISILKVRNCISPTCLGQHFRYSFEWPQYCGTAS
jgi:hypothetical protein